MRCMGLGLPQEFTKMGGIHGLFVWALSLVWFARATPETSFWRRAPRVLQLALRFSHCSGRATSMQVVNARCLMSRVAPRQGTRSPLSRIHNLSGPTLFRRGCSQSEFQVTNFFLAMKNVVKFSVTNFKPLVAQIARCNRDVRCDSNRTSPNR